MAGVPTTYDELQTSLEGWMQDATLSADLPEIIGMTERRLSRKLNTPELDASATLAIVNGVAALPADFMEVRYAYIDYQNVRTPLDILSQADFNRRFASDAFGRPSFYAISGSDMMVRPVPDLAYSITLVYKQSLPFLSEANPTNWLLTKWPDLYVAACIVTASAYGYEDERLPLVSSNAEALLEEVNESGNKAKHSAGPLIMRAPVGDFRPSWVR